MEVGQFIIETTNENQYTYFVRRMMKVKTKETVDSEVCSFIKL